MKNVLLNIWKKKFIYFFYLLFTILLFDKIVNLWLKDFDTFFIDNQAFNFVKNYSKKEKINIRNSFWKQNQTLEIKDPHNPNKIRYYSPSKRYEMIPLPLNADYADGFIVKDTQTNKVIFKVEKYAMLANNWLFDERYIAYFVADYRWKSHPDVYLYLGNLSTGKSLSVCTVDY